MCYACWLWFMIALCVYGCLCLVLFCLWVVDYVGLYVLLLMVFVFVFVCCLVSC